MITLVQLKKNCILQFPSQALKQVFSVEQDVVTFVSLKNKKKRSVYSKDFVLAYCDLLPDEVDKTFFLNTTFLRRAKVSTSKENIFYTDKGLLQGYTIEDEIVEDLGEIDQSIEIEQ